MEVRFKKGKAGRTCSWTAVRRHRARVEGSTMAAGRDLPHDLATYVIERALGIEHGFWGCVSEGATFRSLGRRRTQPGRAVIRSHAADRDAAEQLVGDAFRAWRRGADSPLKPELDEMLSRWRQLDEGEELLVEWLEARPRRGSRTR
jgi:hypothetical protein